METVALLYEDYQKELAKDFKNTFLKRASDTDSSRSNDTVIDEVTDMLSTNIAVYTEKLLQRWGFSSGGEGGGGGDVTVTLDDLLKKYLSDNYVTIKGDQEVFGEKDFRKGIRIAGRRLYWDEGNDALVIEGAAYTTRWLSAKGVSPGGGGAGSGGAAAMYQLIDVSPNDTKDAVLGAEKDYVLTFDGSFWRGMPNKGGLSSKLFTALDKEGHEINPDDENAEIYAIRANYSLWSVGFLSAKGISDGGTGGGGGGAVALYQLLDVEKNADITGVAGATKGSVLTFNGDKWYADKPKTAAGISNLFTALDKDGNEVDLNDESKLGTITNIRANYALWSVDWISAKGKSSGGSGGGGGLINLVYGFESLGGTFDNNDNSATFNAFTINEIWKLASSGLTNVTVTGSGNAVTDVTKGSDGRSLTFTKGSTFATKSEFDALNTKFNDFLTGSDADDIINKWSELEVFLQGMKESDNLAVILQSKMDKSAFNKLFSALDSDGNEIDPSDDTKTVAAIRANFGFWGVDYVSAKGVSMFGVQTGTLADLTDVEITNPTNGQALKYDAISQKWVNGTIDSFNVNQMWTELTKADSSKIIDASHIPTSVLDGRWVTLSTNQTITGQKTFTQNILFSNNITGIRNTAGNLVFGAGNENIFCILNDYVGPVEAKNNQLVLGNDVGYWKKVTAGQYISKVATGVSPLIVSSNTLVNNLNADLLDGQHGAYYQNRAYDTFVSQYNQYDYIEFLRFVIPSGQNQSRAYVVFDLCRTETGAESSGRAVLRLRRNPDNTASTLFYVTNFGRSTLPELRCTSDDGIIWRIWMKCNKSGYDPYIAVKIVEQYPYGYVTTQNNGTTGTPKGTRHVFTALSAGISNAANFLVNSRTLWGQPFNGTANVSGDMTGVGSITMSGDLKIGNATSPNTIYFYGTTGDGPGSYSHTFIAERILGGTECSELVLFKGNDLGNGTDAITVSNPGPDRIRHIAAAHLFQTYTTVLSGSVESVCTSSALKNLFSIASNRVISYVQLQSTIASGTAPFIVASNTVVGNLNADMLDGYHQVAFSMGWTSSTKYRVDRWGGDQDKNWKKIVTYVSTGGGRYQACKVKGTIYYITGNHNQAEVVDIPFEAIMYAYGGTADSMLNQSTLYLPIYCDWDLIRIVRYANNSWEVQVRQPSDWTNISLEYTVTNNGGSMTAGQFANTTYTSSTVANSYNTNVRRPTTSRAGYADKLTKGRTINGTTFDGTANITTSYWGTTRTFYTNSHDSYRASSGVNVNGSGNVTLLLPNSIKCSDWFRSTGNSGWYHQDYGGGWYMQDSTYIRNYGSKRLRIQTDTYDTLHLVRSSGSGGSSIAFYNGGGTFRGQLGVNASSWFSFDTGTATANQNVVEISPAGGIHSKAEITAKASGSDIRLKKDIQNYNAMSIINKFRSVKYHWNDIAKANSEVYNNDYDQFGLIAQDLIAGGFGQWVRDVFHDYYTVTYERLIPVVWKGLQEVDDEVTKLKREVARLNKRVKELEKSLCA